MPKLSNAEAITMEIVDEFMGKGHDRAYGVIFVITDTTGFLTGVRVSTLPSKAPIYEI